MSWLYSRALVEAFLEESSSDGEPSAPLNGSHTQLAYLPPDRMTAFSRLSRFGMTFKPLTADRGEELLMSYRAGFPVRTSALQDGATAWTANAPAYGEKWRGWLAKFDPATSSWRTAQCSLLAEEPELLPTLPRSGTTHDGLLWEQQKWALRINETGFGLSQKFPTPQASDWKNKNHSRDYTLGNIKYVWPTPRSCSAMAATITPESAWAANRFPNLETVVGRRMWPTPTSSTGGANHDSQAVTQGGHGINLAGAVMKWGTPKAQDSRHASWDRGKGNLGEQVAGLHDGGKLNPTWVEWLMGWPLGWTDLKPLEMDKSPNVQQQHGDC